MAAIDRWIEIWTRVDHEAVEAVSEAFQRFAHGGVVIEYEADPGAELAWNEAAVISPARPITIRGYLPRSREGTRRSRQLEEALWHLGTIWPIPPPEMREVKEADWANAWKDHFFAHRVGERLVIKPTWREFAAGREDLVITLDPGMAFGTGLHATTRLCLIVLEQLVRAGDRVLDVGAGSGILSIAAARLGAAGVLALDLDEVAVSAARGNVSANGLDGVVVVRQGSVGAGDDGFEDGLYDVVAANIIAGVIVTLAPAFAASLRPGGHLIASGILDVRLEEVQAALTAAGLERVGVLAEADWRAVVCRRSAA